MIQKLNIASCKTWGFELYGLNKGVDMAFLNEAYRGISPYQDTKVYTPKDLESMGYQSLQITSINKQKCEDLANTVEKIKEFFWKHLHMVGVDDQGTMPPFFIFLKDKNAYYASGSKGEYFNFNDALIPHPEVVCHEFTHAVVSHTRIKSRLQPLQNIEQSGAINEAIADIVGIVFKHEHQGKIDWEIEKMRNLSEPFSKRKLKLLENGEKPGKGNDFGYIHYNSRLISHAFFLAYTELKKTNNQGLLLEIWFKAAVELPDQQATFQNFALKTLSLTDSLLIKEYIRNIWFKVEVFK